MVWIEKMPSAFYKHVYSKDNYFHLNNKNVLYPKVFEINDFLDVDEKKYMLLKNTFSKFKNIFQYVYFNVYPELYCSAERKGFEMKSTFHIVSRPARTKQGRVFEEKSIIFCAGKKQNLHF